MSSHRKRVVVTGMSVNTPVADTLDGYLAALLGGHSAISAWKSIDADKISSKIGGDLAGYDLVGKIEQLKRDGLQSDIAERSSQIIKRSPWSVALSVLLAADAWHDATSVGKQLERERTAAIVAGHNLQNRYRASNQDIFNEEPDYIDALYAVHSHDTTHIGCITDALQLRGGGVLVGAACASGAYAVRAAVDEIRWHDTPAVLLTGAVWDVAPIDMHAMGMINAISQDSFNEQPELASRPFDIRREGFVPAHGGGAIVLEEEEQARSRGARIYAEVLGVEVSSDGSYLPQPSEKGEIRAMQRVLESCNIRPDQIDYINGHFTSTLLGDLAEIRAIKKVFGGHAYNLKMNATKSMIGHTMGSSSIVELIGAILQSNSGILHQSRNIERIDPEIDLDVCAYGPVNHQVDYFMKNTFGFGGLNACMLLRRYKKIEAQK